jgi:hypothetical protein
VSSDSSPEFAKPILRAVAKEAKGKSNRSIIRLANKRSEMSDWIRSSGATKSFRRGVWCEYGYELKPKKGIVKQIPCWGKNKK